MPLLLWDRDANAAGDLNVCGVRAPVSQGAPPEKKPLSYKVRPGDTLTRIASAQETTVAKLMAANSIADPDHLEVGQTLVLGGDGRRARRASSGARLIMGVLVDCHPVCPTILTQGNRVYALSGDLSGFSPGDLLEVKGAPSNSCGAVQAFDVEEVRSAPRAGNELARRARSSEQHNSGPQN